MSVACMAFELSNILISLSASSIVIALTVWALALQNTLKQFAGNNRLIIWVCLTTLWGWRLKGLKKSVH